MCCVHWKYLGSINRVKSRHCLPVALLLSGLMVGLAAVSAAAQATPDVAPAAPPDVTPLLAYVPENAGIVFVARPAELFTDTAWRPHAESLKQMFSEGRGLIARGVKEGVFSPETVEELVLISEHEVVQSNLRSSRGGILLLRSAQPLRKAFLEKEVGANRSNIVAGGVAYQLEEGETAAFPDERTLMIAPDSNWISALFVTAQLASGESRWQTMMSRLENPPLAIMATQPTEFINAIKQSQTGGNSLPPVLGAILPLWEDIQQAAVGVHAGEKTRLVGRAECVDDAGAQRVNERLRGLARLGQSTIQQMRAEVERQIALNPMSKQSDQVSGEMLSSIEQLLAGLKITTNEQSVELVAEAGTRELLLQLFKFGHAVDRERQAKLHLKQLGLAFHNYHDTYGHFPPAVLERNGVKHSWRVAILEYIGHSFLYNQYKLDEPWDSENNKKILEQMPEVFRNPGDTTSDPNSTSYYVITSEHALTDQLLAGEMDTLIDDPVIIGPLPDKNAVPTDQVTLFSTKPVDQGKGEKGPGIRNIADGTSNTIMIVEGNKNIPWTKPEDIPFDPEQLEKLLKEDLGSKGSESFEAALCDGSVRTFPKTIGLKVLSHWITPADGNQVRFPEE